MNGNASKQHFVEGPVTYDLTLHSRVRDHMSRFRMCVGTDGLWTLIPHPHLLVLGHQRTVSSSKGCNQWPSLAKTLLKVALAGGNCSLVARTSKCRWGITFFWALTIFMVTALGSLCGHSTDHCQKSPGHCGMNHETMIWPFLFPSQGFKFGPLLIDIRQTLIGYSPNTFNDTFVYMQGNGMLQIWIKRRPHQLASYSSIVLSKRPTPTKEYFSFVYSD